VGNFKLSNRSLQKLEDCEENLIVVAKRGIEITPYDFAITCGLRTMSEQKDLFSKGLTQTLMSRHLPNKAGLSEAFDFAVYIGGKLTWNLKYYRPVVQAFFTAAIELGVQIESGILWKTFIDGPHIQLRRK